MDFEIRKKWKNVKVEEFARKMKDKYKEARSALVKA